MNSKVKTLVSSTIEKFRSRINDRSRRIPKVGEAYAVGTGIYVGEMLVFVKKHSDNYLFLSIPKNINREVPIDKFDWAIKHKIAEFVERLPKSIYKVCVKQHEYNAKHGGKGVSLTK